MGIALGVEGAFGGFTVLIAVVGFFDTAANHDHDFTPLIFVSFGFCFMTAPCLIGVVIWGGVMGVVWTSAMWTIILSITAILVLVGVYFDL